MASNIRRIVWNTRERLTSTDLNTATALQHRALIESLAAVAHGETQQYGVIRGLVVSVVPASLTVSVSPGLALRSGSAPTTYDSTIEWIELATAEVINLASYVDATNPRWVVIEIADAESVELNTARDIWQPASGTFASSAVDKVTGSDPTITVTAGTAAATPYFPAGTAGRIPLAYVYIPNAVASLDVGNVVLCRPIMRSSNSWEYMGNTKSVEGGGIFVSTDGLTVGLRECCGHIADSAIPFSIGRLNATSTTSATLAMVASGYDGSAVPGADAAIYFYAIQPPYPSGYGSLADREFYAGSVAATHFPSMVSSTGQFRNCVVIASTSQPNLVDRAGAPTAGNFSVNAAPWNNGAQLISRLNSVYLGAACYDFSSTVYREQFTRGPMVYPVGGSNPVHALHDGTNFDISDFDLWAGDSAGNLLPITARVLEVVVTVAPGTATSYDMEFVLEDSRIWHVEGLDIPGTVHFYNPRYLVDSAGESTLQAGSALAADTDLSSASIAVQGYEDYILALR